MTGLPIIRCDLTDWLRPLYGHPDVDFFNEMTVSLLSDSVHN